jgi:hypothetical protein
VGVNLNETEEGRVVSGSDDRVSRYISLSNRETLQKPSQRGHKSSGTASTRDYALS